MSSDLWDEMFRALRLDKFGALLVRSRRARLIFWASYVLVGAAVALFLTIAASRTFGGA